MGNVFKCNGCHMSSHGRKLLIGLCLLVGQIQLNPRRRPRAQADGPGKLKLSPSKVIVQVWPGLSCREVVVKVLQTAKVNCV